ncbi:MAG: hypothetical protein HY692_05225 [Cyanobacteria bacterium NC_groundwater_1444_Ag_S-0.65um_54_12]|nr:hypothetical protein [Cyanobacteria bacterium NC_groundwater_1444_Ag_S-0.65um_54_12]
MLIWRWGALAGVACASMLLAEPGFAKMIVSGDASTGGMSMLSRPGDVWTGGGLLFAPRYLEKTGDLEFGAGPGFVLSSLPSAPIFPFIGQTGFEYKVLDNLELAAIVSPITLAGLRGPILQNEFGGIGWALLYREDTYPAGVASGSTFVDLPVAKLPQGTNKAFFGLVPGIISSRGVDFRLDTMQKLGLLNLFASPRLAYMSNGLRVGGGLGIDLDFERVIIGVSWSGQLNLSPPTTSPGSAPVALLPGRTSLNTFENSYGVGGRLILNEQVYLAGNYLMVPADAYENKIQAVLFGIAYRMGVAGSSTGRSPSSGGRMRTSQ